MWRFAAVPCTLALALLLGCDDTAIVFEIQSSRPVPTEMDGVCLSVAALDAAGPGGAFAKAFPLVDVPQTLTVLPGGHDRVQVWARGTRGGVEVARAGGRFAFQSGTIREVRLDLPSCPAGALTPRVAGTAPSGGRLAYALGWRAPELVDVAAAAGARLTVAGDMLVVAHDGAPEAPADPLRVVAFDADGDCDDDLLVLTPGGGPTLWIQDGDGKFAAGDPGADLAGDLVAAAAADVDGDGDEDLVVGGAGVLKLLRNDGTGRFAADAAAIPAGAAGDVTALALGDLNADGHVDLVIGQGSAAAAPRVALVNDPSGSGAFSAAPALLPALAEQTRALALVDADGDSDLDLFVASSGAPVRLYVNRGDGRLEDQSFVRLPTVDAVDATSIAVADLDGDCLVDVAVAHADGTATLWRGTGTDAFTDVPLPSGAAGTEVVLDDVDGDGVRDLVLAGGGTITWVAPR